MRERVAILGGAGFVGSHLCERFVAEGFDVVCVDNLLTGRVANLRALLGEPRFELVEADVSAPLRIAGPLRAVLHFASPASPADYAAHPVETLKAGSLGTFHALDLARERDARFVLASTSEVYGDPEVHPQTESYWGRVNPVGPRSCYDEAKRFAEAATTALRGVRGIGTGIIRIFNTYGPRMRADDGRAVPTLIAQALRGEPMTVSGDGSQTRSFCYIDDLVEGVFRFSTGSHPGPLNLGNPTELTILELARHIGALAGSDAGIRFIPAVQDDPAVRRPDIDRARTLLRWQPAVGLLDGLRRTIAWTVAEAEQAAIPTTVRPA